MSTNRLEIEITSHIILEAGQDYHPKYENLLLGFIQKDINLFSTLGPYTKHWEDVMDWLCVKLDITKARPNSPCKVISHRDKRKEDAFKFVNLWFELKKSEVLIGFIEN